MTLKPRPDPRWGIQVEVARQRQAVRYAIGRERDLLRFTRLYFVMVRKPDGPIKIGVAKDPAQRLRHLQTSTPDELVLLGHIEARFALERWFHEQFGETRVRGEWFKPTLELLELIAFALREYSGEDIAGVEAIA